MSDPKIDRILSALEHLFGDARIHPVVFQSSLPGGGMSGPVMEQSLQRCPRCVNALFAVAEAYYAYKGPDPNVHEVCFTRADEPCPHGVLDGPRKEKEKE